MALTALPARSVATDLRLQLAIALRPDTHNAALLEKREQLAEARNRLAEREAEVAQLRSQLKNFEARYFRQVGVLYAELDELEARIAECEAASNGTDQSRQRAAEARQRAEETHEAQRNAPELDEDTIEPPGLKALFREVAKRIHPDFARDDAEQTFFHMLMTRANHAYVRGDTEALQRLLDDHLEINAVQAGETAAAEMLRISRQILHANRDMSALEIERYALLASEAARLFEDAEAAAAEHRDLLRELAAKVQVEISGARQRYEDATRQAANGR